MRHLRKLLGVIGFGVTWGVVWAAIVTALALAIQAIHPNQVGPYEGPLRVAGTISWVGFVSGGIFGILLTWIEGEKAIEELSVKRAAMLGILSATVVPVVTGRADQVWWTCPVGAIAAVAMFAFARKAERLEGNERGVLRVVIDAFFVAPVRYVVTPGNSSKRMAR